MAKGTNLGLAFSGLTVKAVREGSLSSGLVKAGDTITAVSGNRIASQKEFLDELERAKHGSFALRLYVLPAPATSSADRPLQGHSAGPPPPPPPPLPPRTSGYTQDSSWAQTGNLGFGSRLSTGLPEPPESMIVLNCEDIGRCASQCCAFFGDPSDRTPFFPWEAVRRAIAYYEMLGFLPQPVCHQATMARHPPPSNLSAKLVQCPVIDNDGRSEGRGSDRMFVLNMAKMYSCPFVDNSNYREQVWSSQDQWPWLQTEGLGRKVEYIFDSFGEFLPSRDVRAGNTTQQFGRYPQPRRCR
ncbi:unnamed protein product [Polarella glacialis]|uniref:PDZ domain-containing protein n=1 Tax=Polarella glacialis TaxID=89957 RepID=A0A813GGE4_POLGL|nr:unnamed protein product [Polarella glacialis]